MGFLKEKYPYLKLINYNHLLPASAVRVIARE